MNEYLRESSARDERVSLLSLSLLGMLIFFLFLAANQAGMSQAAPSGPEMSAVELPLESLEGGECVDFEDLQVETQYVVDNVFTTSGVEIMVAPFVWDNGTPTPDGFAQVQNNSPSQSGGTGNEMAVNNVNLSFNFGKPIMGLTLRFGEYGGNVNLEINGEFHNVNNFADLPNVIGGVEVQVFGGNDNQSMGELNLQGRINSFAIGGQELWIDDICPKLPDVGDAPDSETNHTGDFMSAYSGPIEAHYPTVFDPATGLPPGPAHWFPRQDAWLGQWVTREFDADMIPDEDSSTNLTPSSDLADMDEADDGVIFPNEYPHCEPVEMQVLVTIVGSPNKRFVNAWFDWNHDGDWEDSFDCPTGQMTSEWAVRDFLITEPNTGTHLITLPTFLPYNIDPVDDGMWVRVTLSELPGQVDSTGYADGRGPDFGFRFGETEDYYFPAAGDPTATPSPTPSHHVTITPTNTPTQGTDVTPTATPTQGTDVTPTATPTCACLFTPTPTPSATPTQGTDVTPTPTAISTGIPTIVVTKVAHVSEVKLGEEIDYSVIVKNEGESDATGIVVEDAIPAHTSYVDSSASSGEVSYDEAANQIRWHGNIAASEMVTIGLTVQAHGGTASELPSWRHALAALATIDFETPALGSLARQVINPYTDGSTGVVFETTSTTWGDEVVGLVKNNSTSACVNPSDQDQKLGTGRANGATGGNIGFSGFPIKGTFPGELAPPVTVSVEFQTLAGQPIRLRLFDSAGNEVASTTDVAAPANGTCGYPGDERARTTISATSTQPVAYAMMDMGTVTGSYVFVIDNFEFDSGTEKVCQPIITNRAHVVMPTGQVIASTQVSTNVLCADMGDAPDSETNHFGDAMSAYGAVLGYYPTVYDPGTGLPEGPAHWKPEADAWLGDDVTLEIDADLMPDEDGHPNLVPPGNISNWDEADDGLITDTLELNHCQDSKFEVEVNIVGGVNERYLNVWFDWNRDGDWEDRFECQNGEVITEWAVQDQVIGLGNGTHTVPTNIFKAYNPKRAVWMRVTLSEQVAPRNPSTGLADGRGPAGGYRYGETEDYLYRPATGSIHGQKWHDMDGDGVKDDNEPPLADWRILIKDESGHVKTTTTDDEGNYWFMDLPSGVYSATEFIPSWSDWRQTFPTTGTHTIDLDPGEVVEGVDFGNWQGGQKNDFCILPWDNHFLTPDTLETQVYIFNDSNTPNKAYRVQLVGLPAGTNGSAADGPTQFDILDPMPLLLNPGEYGTVDVRVYYPDSFAAGNPGPAYFIAIVTNLASGTSFTCQAALWPVLPWWTGPVNLGIGGIPPGFEKGVAFRVMNNNDGQTRTLTGSETITYTVRAMTPGIEDSDDGSSSIVSLNGQPAGETISGQVTLGAGEEITVNIGIEFMNDGGEALGPTDILFEMDIDGDGNPDAITTGLVQAVEEGPMQIFLPLISR